MELLTKMWEYFITKHGTKTIGFVQIALGAIGFIQITLGAIAVADFWSPNVLKAMLMVNGVLVAWRGFFNSSRSNPPSEEDVAKP